MNPVPDTHLFVCVLHGSCLGAELLSKQGSPLGNPFCVAAWKRTARAKAILENVLSLEASREGGGWGTIGHHAGKRVPGSYSVGRGLNVCDTLGLISPEPRFISPHGPLQGSGVTVAPPTWLWALCALPRPLHQTPGLPSPVACYG